MDEEGTKVMIHRSRMGMQALGSQGHSVAAPPSASAVLMGGAKGGAGGGMVAPPPPPAGGAGLAGLGATMELKTVDLSAFTATMKQQQKVERKRKKAPTFKRDHMDALAKPKDTAASAPKHSNIDDMKHCRFQPKINKASRDMLANKGADKAMFIIRMESQEQARRNAITSAVGEADYTARLDRKMCPNCGNYQSYSEWKAKIKRCQGEKCRNALFRPKLAWGDVAGGFLTRLEETQQKKQAALEDVAKKTTPAFRPTKKVVVDPTTGRPKEVTVKPRSWSQVRGEFLKRNEEDQKKRLEKAKAAEDVSKLPEEFSFKPQLNTHKITKDLGSFEDRMKADVVARMQKKAKMEAMLRKAPKIPGFKAAASKGRRGSRVSSSKRSSRSARSRDEDDEEA